MKGKEAMRVFMGLYAPRGGVNGLRACVLCSQCRTMSTEAKDSVRERCASSWSGAIERSVSKERGFLLRTSSDRPDNGTDSVKEVTRYYIDTQAMVKTLEENGGRYPLKLLPLCFSDSSFPHPLSPD